MTAPILGQTANIFTSSFEDSSKPSNEYGVSSADALTMSSLEIAEYTGKDHKHILFDIRGMLIQLEIDSAGFSAQYKDSTGRALPMFNLPKDLTITLVSGYSAPMRHAIVKRWLELESTKPLFAIPTTLSAALRLAADQSEQIDAQKAQLAIAAPKVAALDRIATSDGSMCFTDAAKTLQIQRKKLTQILQEHQWAYRRPMGGTWLAYQNRIQQGLMEHKVTTGEKTDGSEWSNTQARITSKGLAKLAGMFAQ